MQQFIGPGSIGMVGGLLIIIATGSRGMWQFRFQVDKELSAKDMLITNLERQLTDQRAGSLERLSEMRNDREEWKEIAYSLSDLGKRAATIAEKSVK